MIGALSESPPKCFQTLLRMLKRHPTPQTLLSIGTWEHAVSKVDARTSGNSTFTCVLWNVFSQTMTVGLKPVALPEGAGIYSRLPRP